MPGTVIILGIVHRARRYDGMHSSNESLVAQVHSPVFFHDLVNHAACFLILFERAFYENIAETRVRDLLLSYLDPCTAFQLQRTNSLPTFANDKTYALIGHWDYVSL